MRLRSSAPVLLTLAALAAGGCEINAQSFRAEGSFARTLTTTGPVELEVETGSGDIKIETGAAGTVQVHGLVRAGWGLLSGRDAAERVREIEANPPVEQTGNVIRLGARRRWDNVSISYTVTVPPDTRVKARSGSGDQFVGSLQGAVDVETGSGDILVGGAAAVRANTGSGDVRLDSATGDVEARTGSGDVVVRQSGKGRTTVSTGSGDVVLSSVRGALRVSTGSGDIEVDGSPTAPWEVGASSGNVTVRVPPDAAFNLSAHTSSGRIESAPPVTVAGQISRKELRGKVRGGGPVVELSTSSGDIVIR